MDVLERLTPEQASEPSVLALTHVHRYRLAAAVCEGKRVLDLCCGSGYGSVILAERAASVLGVDAHGPSIERAAANGGPARFERADALDVLDRPLAEEVDAIVLLEGLEHLAELERAIEALRRHVAAGVGLVVSVPNSRAFGERNPHHVTDFDYEGARRAFERVGVSTVLHQFHAQGSLIRAAGDGPVSGTSTLSERAEPEHCNHLIGLANLDRATGPGSAELGLVVAPEPNTYMVDLERANERLRRTNLRLARERIGVADSAAAAAVERLRRADEDAPPLSPRARIARALKRAVTLIIPHGLVVAWMQLRNEGQENDER